MLLLEFVPPERQTLGALTHHNWPTCNSYQPAAPTPTVVPLMPPAVSARQPSPRPPAAAPPLEPEAPGYLLPLCPEAYKQLVDMCQARARQAKGSAEAVVTTKGVEVVFNLPRVGGYIFRLGPMTPGVMLQTKRLGRPRINTDGLKVRAPMQNALHTVHTHTHLTALWHMCRCPTCANFCGATATVPST